MLVAASMSIVIGLIVTVAPDGLDTDGVIVMLAGAESAMKRTSVITDE